ncbi:unnamed protein product [Caenorhabditis angaria]|uniref:Metalloendopeptidase n=1 Tax=Caenorhabditis angaria TaxID=860376 RepID=A0A9P1N1G5_9PELO|nr:unnamed protein product [Caenorhabditis angaria]
MSLRVSSGRSKKPAVREETFLTEEDFLRPLNDDETFLTADDFKNADNLQRDHIPAGKILWKQVFRKGDIRGKAAWKLENSANLRRNGVITGTRKWPNGRIPYVISNQYNERERAVLARSFQSYHDKTCIRFVPRTAVDNDYLYIGKIDGCYSDVGRAGGRQELSLDNGCLQYDTAIHELMHSVGFYHEHERWDRDEHITILWHNIDREAYDQFGKVDLAESSYYGQLYDYYSIMHYDSLAFSKNGFETMVAKASEMTPVIGAAIDFSPIDVLKMNLMYQCTDLKTGTSPAVPLPLPTPSEILENKKDSRTKSIEPTQKIEDEDCRDRTNLCWRWSDRCKSFFFEKIMQEFCALSCGFCVPKKPQGLPNSVSKASPPAFASTILTKSSTSYLNHG